MKIVVEENTKERSVFAIVANGECMKLYISVFGPGGHVSCNPNFAFKSLIFFFPWGPIQSRVLCKLGVLSF